MKKSGLPRSEIFFTSKVPPRNMGYDNTKVSSGVAKRWWKLLTLSRSEVDRVKLLTDWAGLY